MHLHDQDSYFQAFPKIQIQEKINIYHKHIFLNHIIVKMFFKNIWIFLLNQE